MGAQRGGRGPNPEKVGPKGLGARRGWGPKISRFFFSLPPEVSFFLLSLGGSSRGIVAAVQGHGPPKMRVSVGVILCEPRRPSGLTFLDHLASPACSQLHAGERSHSLWFLRPRALAVWRVPHLTSLTFAVRSERIAHPHLADS